MAGTVVDLCTAGFGTLLEKEKREIVSGVERLDVIVVVNSYRSLYFFGSEYARGEKDASGPRFDAVTRKLAGRCDFIRFKRRCIRNGMFTEMVYHSCG